MRALTSSLRTGAWTALLSLLIATLFAYANLLCVAGSAAFEVCEHHDADGDCAGAEPAHHDEAPTHPAKHCSKDSCFCLTMNTVVTQPTITKPNQAAPLRVVDFAVLGFPDVTRALTAAMAYEHGPPAIAPPSYLFSKSLSSRAPPLGA